MNARGFSLILIWGSQRVAVQGLLDSGAASVGVFAVTVFKNTFEHMCICLIWVIVKIMVPFGIPIIIQHLILRVPKRDHNFDNHPYIYIYIYIYICIYRHTYNCMRLQLFISELRSGRLENPYYMFRAPKSNNIM